MHWPNHIRVNKLKKSSLGFILRSQKRSPEHLSHYTDPTRACRWAPDMQLDFFDSIGEPLNCWQREMTETSMADKDIFSSTFCQMPEYISVFYTGFSVSKTIEVDVEGEALIMNLLLINGGW